MKTHVRTYVRRYNFHYFEKDTYLCINVRTYYITHSNYDMIWKIWDTTNKHILYSDMHRNCRKLRNFTTVPYCYLHGSIPLERNVAQYAVISKNQITDTLLRIFDDVCYFEFEFFLKI